MPLRIKKQACTKADDTRGSYVVQKKTVSGWKKRSCHDTRDKASAAARIRGQADVNEGDAAIIDEVRNIVRTCVHAHAFLSEAVQSRSASPTINNPEELTIDDALEYFEGMPGHSRIMNDLYIIDADDDLTFDAGTSVIDILHTFWYPSIN